MQLLSFAASAMSWLWQILNSLWLMICQAIYPCINFAYMLFEKVASVNLFSDEIFQKLTGRIYVIMGIAMLFIFAYNLILMVINPEDKKGSGATGKLVKDIIISLTVVVLLPTIFNWLHVVQAHILEDNVIGTLILGGAGTNGNVCDSNDYECKCEFNNFAVDLTSYKQQFEIPLPLLNLIPIKWSSDRINYLTNSCKIYRSLNGSKRGARSIPPTIFSAFYTPSNFNFEECRNYLITGSSSVITSGSDDEQICVNYYYDVSISKYTGNMLPFVYDGYLNAIIADGNNDSMQFHWLLAIIAGCFAAWAFLCYAMEIGVRVAKLGFLELISPIPVMMRVLPQNSGLGGMYNKWFKQYTNTFFDVFIRVFIINFSLFAISLVPDVIDALWKSTTSDDGGFFIKTLALVIIILGILKFAQDAPNLFKELFGGMGGGNFKIRSPKAQFNDNKLAKKGVGFIGGMATGGVSAAMRGKNPFIGALSGGKHTATSMGNADLTKKGGFTNAMKQGKKDSDEAQRNSKFTAFRRKVEEKGGVSQAFDSIINEKYTGLENWLRGTTNDDKKQATSRIKSNIDNVDDIVTENIKKKENIQKSNFENQRDVYLKEKDGQEYVYKRQSDGRWQKFDSSGGVVRDASGVPISSNSNEEMATLLKTTFDNQKKNAIVENINNQVDFAKEWTSNFINILKDELPRLDVEDISQITTKLKSVVDADVKLKGKFDNVNDMSDLIKKMSELRNVSVNGNKNDSETKEAQELFAIARSVLKSESNSINKRIYEQEKKDIATGKDDKK